jgi:UDP:flavonoid glycosyltransferase YjiC (YdhE family)
VFITHCGLGSLKETLWYGKPIIAMPIMEADQPTNAAYAVHTLKIGLSFDSRWAGDVMTADNLNAKIRQLLAA